MLVLVTGGAGYVGSHAVLELIASGHEPVVLDDLSLGHRNAVPKGIELHVIDLADAQSVEALLARRRFDAVMHFAARSIVPESMRDPMLYFSSNVANAINLIRAAAKCKVDGYILSSTANIFGPAAGDLISESSPIVPGSPYGESKRIIEQMLGWADRLCGLRYAALRYFNAAGADPLCRTGERHAPETHLIPIVLEAAAGKRTHVDVFGSDYPTDDGTAVRDYVHVSDLARAHVLALEALCSGAPSMQLNIGTGTGSSVLEIIEAAERATGEQINTCFKPRREGDPAMLVACADRAKDVLGWKPKHDLESIVRTAWAWHSAHPDGFGT